MSMTETLAASAFGVTANAARRIAFIMEHENQPGAMMRIAVSGGGCSGFQYGFSIDDTANDDDRVFERDGAKVVIDETSLELLAGSEIDYVEDLVGSAFQIRNPNAKSGCGCGNSFSV
ncbi:MAG: iron-sulfur cluster insertion protein ErpA [Alphaproteobacteria bacterium]|nr:MAG: iron-sulfur cluster insertion protein ErpA [Alphaproteobacteria bacterium]